MYLSCHTVLPLMFKYYTNQVNLFYDYCVMYISLKLALTDIFCVKFLLALTIGH